MVFEITSKTTLLRGLPELGALTEGGRAGIMGKTLRGTQMKTKRIFALLFCFFLLVQVPNGIGVSPNGAIRGQVFDYTSGQYGAETEFDVVGLDVNGTTISDEVPGIVLNGRTLAPLRVLAEAIGAEVLWSKEAAEVTIQKGDTNIVLTLGSAYARVNGQVEALPDGVPATAVFLQGQGHTMVPARFFCGAAGVRCALETGKLWGVHTGEVLHNR